MKKISLITVIGTAALLGTVIWIVASMLFLGNGEFVAHFCMK